MKTKCSFILKTSVALLLAILMVLGSVSTVIAAVVDVSTGDQPISTAAKKGLDIAGTAANADLASTGSTDCTIYIYPADLWDDYAGYTIKCNANIGDNNTWIQRDFTDTGRTINGKVVYSASFTAKYDGVDALQIQKYDGSTWKEQKVPYSSWTTASTFNGKIYNGSTWATKPAYDVIKTPLTTPTISIGGKTSGATVASGSTAAVKITNWSSFDSSISGGYCTLALYKGDAKIGDITQETTNFTFTESGDYYVKCEPTASTEATYSASSSSTVDVTVTLTIYVKNAADWENIYYYVYTSDSSHGKNWPGTQITSTAIGTIDEKNVYKVEGVPQYSYIILNNNSGNQYPNNVALANGKLYPTGTTAPEVVDYSSSLLDKPKHDVTFTPSPTGGTVTIDGSSTSPAKVAEDENFTILAKPDTGYTVDTVKVGDTTLTAQSGSDSDGYTYTSNVGKAAKTVTVSFKMINYAVSVGAKYSNDGTTFDQDFSSTTKPEVSIGANTATQINGVKVTAPATDPTGYVFAGWYTATGSFTAPNDKETTFKPNAANAKAIARYKKLHTIAISVDDTGTGAGTATVDKTSVEAGGSYTIDATAKSGSAVESVKVNDTAKTATASQTISNVSANQTVVVKFKSNVYLKGTMNSEAWAGDVMTANSAGTSYTIANVVLEKDTTYQFRLYADNDWKENSVTTWTLNNIATHGTSGDNLTIKPSVKAKVTFVSDGTKFTSITAIPYDSTTYNVTLTQSADYTITSTYMGVEYTTAGKNANVTVPVYSGTGFSYTVTPASGKYLSGVAQSNSVALSPTFSATTHANSYTGTVSSVSEAFAVSATVANKLIVKAVTNKSARGTVSIDNTTAAPGESITITVSPKNGVLKSLTATYANGAVYTCDLTSGLWTRTTAPTAGTSAAPASTGALETVFLHPLKSMFGDDATDIADDDVLINAKPDLASTGASSDIAGVGVDTTYNMTLAESSAVTINATFDSYSAESNYYYYGYDDSGNVISAYNGKQMTEGMISGEKFSYYQVNGRTEDNQRFKVATKASGTRRFYVETPGITDWTGNNGDYNPYIYWFDNEWGTFEKLTWVKNVDNRGTGRKWWYTDNIHEGVGCLIVNMNNTSDGGFKQTADISADDVAYGAVWINSTMSNNKYNIGGRFTENDRPGDAGTGATYYSWGDGVYATGSDSAAPYSFGTSGFNDHDQNYAKPNGDGFKDGSYYVLVLYPNTTYTINNVTKTTGDKIDVIWMSDLPSDDENVTVYAKDGSIRSESYGSTYANIADTKIYLNNETVGIKHSGNITNQTYETYKAAKGDTLVIKTQIGATDSGTLSNSADLIAKYYVRGFCVNGEVSELLEWNENGLYTLTYKIPEDTEITKFEITPIYYLKDTTANPIVTYRVTGFTDELKQVGAGKPNWGDTLYTYPFYGKLGSNNNALGAYPGQPMVYYKGQYQMQIPQKSTAWDIYYDDSALSGYSGNPAKANAVANTAVSGVTMSNGYYDIVHRSIMGYGSNGSSADHVQTYDYGDFFKIFNEKKPVDNIVFDFKYRTKKHNFENQPAASTTKSTLDTNYGTDGNGFELLTNFHGRNVDLFGTPLSGDAADPSKTTPVYVVSIGGVNGSAGVENIAGYYATEWMVYGSSDGSSYSRISAGGRNSIPPEVLVLNDDDDNSFNSTTYPSADANHNITNWKALYTALEAYRGKPVMISYEAADAQIGAGNYATSGGGGATRNDGRWLYSKNGENITSNIKIQYSENGTDYVDYTESSTVTGLEAYFTNADAYKKQTYATTIDPDKTFDFEAKTTNSDYMFVGWYMADGTKITSDNASHTERSGSYTFVAKFKKVTEGQLVLSHSVATGKTMTIGSADYTLDGSGTAKIGAIVKDHESGEILATYEPDTSDIILDKKYIGSEKDYDVEVTLVAKADENTALGTTELVEDATKGVLNDPFFNNPTTDTSVYKQRTYTFSFNVKSDLYGGTTTQKTTSLIYHSYFIQYKFNYTLNYEYIDRNGQARQMKRMGTLTSAEANTYIEKRGDTRYLLTSFIEKMAPYESNFGQDITWNFTDVAFGGTGSNYEYSLNQHFSANQENLNKRNITFALPYQHNNGVAVMTDGVGTKVTTTNLELIAVTDEDGKITQDNRVDFNMIPVLPNNAENGIFTEEGKKNWIAAPATIKDGDSVLNFQYWSVKPTDRAGENDPDVARCYFQGFNFVAYDNYIITPVYGASTVDPSDFGKNTNITYVETNRNQWNTNGTDYDYKTQKDRAADLLYNDFIVAYNYDGKDIYNGEANNDIAELGVVVERIQKLEIKDDGTYDTTLSRYTGIETHEDEVDKVINGTSTEKNYTKHAIATNNLDNKNRIQFYNGVYNTAGWKQNTEGGTPTAYYTYKNYVYRAYSYMKLTDGTIIKSAVPAYFTMYDVATADAADM